jgi:DNA-binding CsgD family transcriptional regulator
VLEGVVSLWRGELEQGRAPLEQAHRVAVESGDPWLLMHSLAYLSALETGSGDPRRGLELARRYLALAAETGQEPPRLAALWPLATAAAWLGRADEVRSVSAEALAIAGRTGQRLYAIGCLAALGDLELSLGASVAAVAALARARELAGEGGIVAVGRISILPAAVEALVASDDLEQAASAAEELRAHAAGVDRPWLGALADRAGGLVAAAGGDLKTARQLLDRSLVMHALQPRPLERARTELVRGSVLRRCGAKREARLSLEAAEATFAAAGAEAWREQAARELGRIGGRRAPAGDRLSETESRIAELVAAGRTNAETARELRLSPRTVEWNLSRIYRKLSVRSRSELAATLAAMPRQG